MQKLYVASHVAPYLTKLHPDDREGILVRVCDRPTDTATQELLVVGTGRDFTQELVLDSLPVHGQHRAQPLKVEFDGAEGGCMWLFQEGGGIENIVCVRDTSCAVALANHLLAWTHAESKKPKPSTEEGSTQCAQ